MRTQHTISNTCQTETYATIERQAPSLGRRPRDAKVDAGVMGRATVDKKSTTDTKGSPHNDCMVPRAQAVYCSHGIGKVSNET
jgi:hypothetical protein